MRTTVYERYRESGVYWLGKVPAHWRIVPARVAVRNIDDNNDGAQDQNYLSLVAGRGVIPYADKGDMGNKKPDDLGKCKLVRRGNIVLNSMNFFIGSYGMSPYDGVCSPVYIVLGILGETMHPRFALRVFGTSSFQTYLATFGDGILKHRAAVSWDDIKGRYLPCPPIDEQTQIARFLDYETATIDALIEKQQQLIALLKEKRQAVISHAVTKGLNPNAPLRNSTVEWLGMVPAYWEILPIRRLIRSIEQGSSPIAYDMPPGGGERGVLKLSAVKQGVFLPHEAKTLDERTPFEAAFSVRQGDLLVTRGNTPDLVADACVVLADPVVPLMMSDLVYRLNVNRRVSSEYLCLFLLSSFARAQIKNDARGSSMSMAKVSQGHIRAWLAPLPGRTEQEEIVKVVRQRLAKLDALVSVAHRAVNLLQERRIALISGAVTGKIDVRGWKPPESKPEQDAA